jgi:hypothetical protein
LIAQGLPHFQRDAPQVKEDVTPSPEVRTSHSAPEMAAHRSVAKTSKEKTLQRHSISDADLTVTVRSLRNTPGEGAFLSLAMKQNKLGCLPRASFSVQSSFSE